MTDGGRALHASVVIAAFEAAGTLGEQLEALCTQDGAPPFEVIVADNGSTDGTRAVAESFAPRLRLTVVDASGGRGPAHARNAGAARAAAERLLFCDADDVVSPAWVRGHASCRSGVATGPVPPWDGRGRPRPKDRPHRGPAPTHMGFLPYGVAANLSIDRGAFEALGGFDTALLTAEDIDLCWRAQLGGERLEFLPDAVVHKRTRVTAAGTLRQYYAYGLTDPVLHRRYDLPRERITQVLRGWAAIVATLPLSSRPDQRVKLLKRMGRRWGRVVGSLRIRAWYP